VFLCFESFIFLNSRYVTAKRRGEEEHQVALLLKKLLIGWVRMKINCVVCVVFERISQYLDDNCGSIGDRDCIFVGHIVNLIIKQTNKPKKQKKPLKG
jgi:hypothetical protein